MATGNTNYGTDGLLATTMDKYRKNLIDAVFTQTPLLHILQKSGIETSHGNKIVQPLLYGELSSHGSFSNDDVFAAPVASGITAAEYGYRQYYASVRFTGLELATNSGPQQVLSLLKARMKQAEMTISQELNRQFFADGSGNGGKDWEGLATIFAQANTYGNIDRSDVNNAFWKANVTPVGASNLTIAQMRTKYNDITEGSEHASHIITTQAGYEAYEGLLQDQVRYEDTELGDAGFQSLMYKRAPMVFDRDTTVGDMLFLNTEYLKIVNLDGKWFDMSDWLRPVNQDVQYKNILLYGNLTCTNAKRQGALTGIDNA